MQKPMLVLMAAVLLGGFATVAEAQSTKKQKGTETRQARSPSAIAERQRHKSTFDETEYYERLSEKIPFGTAAWWRQKQIESTNE